MGRVAGKVAIVTGGGVGLGRASSLLLAREGAKLVVTDVDEGTGSATAQAIIEQGGEAMFARHDVASEQDWIRVMEQTQARFGDLDILVNNAGVALEGNVEAASLERWRQLMAINLDGVFLGVRAAIGAMKHRGAGSIINLSSIAGMVGIAGAAAYCASKGGVRSLTKAAALHCAQVGYRIRVNSIHPGYIWTPMVENFLAATPDPVAAKAAAAAAHPVGHMGEPDDVAYGVLYLASDEAKFVTGAELVIDGGYTAQ
ncbi:MAG: glucose 1-dehydrogenase [Hyphomonadaceae bacterium]|nr:glucose 1-dehydrogenase [Hyphomonadaceae bacterium]